MNLSRNISPGDPLQFELAYDEDGQRKNSPFPAHIAMTGKWPDGIMFSELKAVVGTHLTVV